MLLTLAFAGLFLAGSATADDDERARAAYQAGVAARDRGDFALCASKAREATRLLGGPRLRVQGLLVDCVHRLGNDEDTVRESEVYVRLGPDRGLVEYEQIVGWKAAAQRRIEGKRAQQLAEEARRAKQRADADLRARRQREEEAQREAEREQQRIASLAAARDRVAALRLETTASEEDAGNLRLLALGLYGMGGAGLLVAGAGLAAAAGIIGYFVVVVGFSQASAILMAVALCVTALPISLGTLVAVSGFSFGPQQWEEADVRMVDAEASRRATESEEARIRQLEGAE